MRISDWSSDVCSSDLIPGELIERRARFYICGAPQAILQTKRDLLARAVFPFEIFEERFRSPRPAAVPAPDAPRRITLARSGRSEERRVGKECVSKGRSRWCPYH